MTTEQLRNTPEWHAIHANDVTYGYHIEHYDGTETFHTWTYPHPTTASLVGIQLMRDERYRRITIHDDQGNRVNQFTQPDLAY